MSFFYENVCYLCGGAESGSDLEEARAGRGLEAGEGDADVVRTGRSAAGPGVRADRVGADDPPGEAGGPAVEADDAADLVGARRLGRAEGEAARDRHAPRRAVRLDAGAESDWTLGGGTALARFYGHRASRDIDVFLTDARILPRLSPRTNTAAARAAAGYDESNVHLKIRWPAGLDCEAGHAAAPSDADRPTR